MSLFEKIVHALQYEIETPKSYGLFHISFLIATIVAAILLVIFFHDSSEKTFRKILFAIWITMVALEIYKQTVFSMSVTDGAAVWDFQWYAFPFQFCSTPLYALPFIIFLKEGRVRDAFMTFFSGFSLFAGLAVMFYPNDVFISMLGIDIQTMVHHGSQVAIGVLVAAHSRKRTNLKALLGSLFVFYAFTAVAMVLNISVYSYFTASGIDESFNMFYISPYFDCTLPVLSSIYKMVPYAAFLVIYIFGFSFVSALFYSIEKGITKLCAIIKSKVVTKKC